MCASGRKAMKTSFGPGTITPWLITDAMSATKFLWVSMTPFGRPVEPEVYMM
eukprot:CAMPEP_0168389690 /NCGR_PEP_ID=MMETSP0228-20121227/17091_1 /TAXON_ID=133427 /ORGANISM="Protoceratium reticulatum, Strain CCCM 535 (=CCMP 1889)" /LENGTH=51 /DNA_ID=CAMNT_0008402965 /DNA_START=209 /DNA_END=361 /DNA_ORIENTATION=+